ncbi:MAG: DinB family protein [Acidobacteriota bacterium]|nr:DinB family protein [Acidobacteriota bacterium]
MAIKDALLPEFDYEMATARKVIERVPDDKFGYKPHDKSMTMGRLASHIAEMPTWATSGITLDSLDLAGGYKPFEAASRAELLASFDKNVAGARTAIAGASDETLMKNWSLKNGDKTLMTMPKIAVVRTFVMNHVIHHRGQLSVYLRLNNVAVPSIYGPSADEGSMG